MPTVERLAGHSIGRRWLEAWNSHDVASVVKHFTDDVVVTSPLIENLRPGSAGRLSGRDAVVAYYEEGLSMVPDLHFSLVEVLCGVNRVTIVYRNQRNVLVAETLTITTGGNVIAVDVSYGASA